MPSFEQIPADAPNTSPSEVFDSYGIEDPNLAPGNAEGKLTFLLEKERRAKEIQHYNATHDELTGGFNRRGLLEAAEERGLPDAALVVDNDNFKLVNDWISHDRGDRLIEDTYRVLMESVRAQDVVARIGGDEFIVFLYDTRPETAQEDLTTNTEDLPLRAISATTTRIKEGMASFLDDSINADIKEHNIPLGISVGGAALENGMDVRDLLNAADESMYLDKNMSKESAIKNSTET